MQLPAVLSMLMLLLTLALLLMQASASALRLGLALMLMLMMLSVLSVWGRLQAGAGWTEWWVALWLACSTSRQSWLWQYLDARQATA